MMRLLQIAFRNLLESKRRTVLLGGAIALVTFVLVSLSGLSNGIRDTIMRSATTLSTGHVNIGGFYKTGPSTSRFAITDIAEMEAVVAEHVPEAVLVVRRQRGGFERVISDMGSLQNAVVGIDGGNEVRMAEVLDVLDGDLAELAEPGTALLFEQQATDLGVKVGDGIIVSGKTARGVRNTVDLRVAAIASDMGLLSAFSTYVNTASVTELLQLNDTTAGVLFIYLPDPDESAAVATRLRTVLEAKGHILLPPEAKPFWRKQGDVNREDWVGQRLDVSTWRDEVASLMPIVDGLEVFTNIVVGALIVIILVGLAMTLWMSVRDRTMEIGTLRAIGMSRFSAGLLIMLEAASLSVAASLVGALMAIILAAILNAVGFVIPNEAAQIFLMSKELLITIDGGVVGGAVGLFAAASAFAALIPAFRAANVPPAAAMRHAG